MRKDLRTLQGDVISYFEDPKALPLALINSRLNDAIESILVTVRETDSNACDAILYLDLEADRDVIDLPPAVGTLKQTERLDLGNPGIPLEPLPARIATSGRAMPEAK